MTPPFFYVGRIVVAKGYNTYEQSDLLGPNWPVIPQEFSCMVWAFVPVLREGKDGEKN